MKICLYPAFGQVVWRLKGGIMVTKKSAKKASSKAVSKPIIIELQENYTLEDLRLAITQDIFECLRHAHKHHNSKEFLANVIPLTGGPGNG